MNKDISITVGRIGITTEKIILHHNILSVNNHRLEIEIESRIGEDPKITNVKLVRLYEDNSSNCNYIFADSLNEIIDVAQLFNKAVEMLKEV